MHWAELCGRQSCLQAAFQAAVEQTTHAVRTYSSGFMSHRHPAAKPEKFVAYREGGLKGHLQARLPARKANSPFQFAGKAIDSRWWLLRDPSDPESQFRGIESPETRRDPAYEPPEMPPADVEPAFPAVRELLMDVQIPCRPPEKCQRIPRHTKAMNAVIRQYSATSCPRSSSHRKRDMADETFIAPTKIVGAIR